MRSGRRARLRSSSTGQENLCGGENHSWFLFTALPFCQSCSEKDAVEQRGPGFQEIWGALRNSCPSVRQSLLLLSHRRGQWKCLESSEDVNRGVEEGEEPGNMCACVCLTVFIVCCSWIEMVLWNIICKKGTLLRLLCVCVSHCNPPGVYGYHFTLFMWNPLFFNVIPTGLWMICFLMERFHQLLKAASALFWAPKGQDILKHTDRHARLCTSAY